MAMGEFLSYSSAAYQRTRT